MAYEGGYPAQRPYPGPGAQRPGPPLEAYQQGPPQHYDAPQQQYDGYQDNYAYDQYDNGGYGQNYGGQHHLDQGYGRGPPPNQQYPPQDQYGPGPGPGPGRGGRPPMGRGGPMARPPTADSARSAPFPPRGGPPGPGRGFAGGPPARGGRPMQYERSANSDPASSRQRPPMDAGPISPDTVGGFGGAFPVFPGHQRRADFEQESDMISQMASMDIAGPRNGPPPGGGGAQRSQMRSPEGDYGRPPMDARGPPRGYQQYENSRRGPAPAPHFGAKYRDDAYGAPPPANEFGPPGRSMTMPTNVDPMARGPLQRTGTMPYNTAPDRGMPQPARPATSQSHRPPPQRMYPPVQEVPQSAGGYGGYDNGDQAYYGGNHQEAVGDVLDSYYTPSRMSNPEYARNPPSVNSGAPSFEEPGRARGSFDHQGHPGMPSGPQPGPGRTPDLRGMKSQPNLRQPQAAVFEMVGDAPPMPPINGARHGSFQDSYDQNGWEHQSGAGGPVPVRPGLPNGPAPQRLDTLPHHPAPVRPGHMAGSAMNVNDRPMPVRNYNGTSQSPMAGPQQQAPPEPQRNSGTPASTKAAQPPVTNEELEHLRMVVKNDPNDQESALRLAKRLIEAADVLVAKIADQRGRGRARERYLMDASKILKKLSNAQNLDAMFLYADSLGRGLFGAEPENKEAFTLYQSAAKLGHAAAAYRTAVCCEIGNEDGGGTRRDPLKAIQWYKRAATLGDTPAMYKVGMILLKGLLGQQKNPREAVGWLKRAAERADPENPHALHELGLLYESAGPNDAIVKDETYALQLFQQAAELGYKFSQFRLGCVYEYGLMGCPVDPRQSIMWYSKAATQEEHQAELALSGWYLTGSEGVLQQSDTEAYLWARKAAIAGLAKAEYAMGYFTEVGIGAPANLEDAKRWYWRAAAQDFPKARERLEDLKRVGNGKAGPRQRERVSRSKMGKQQEVFR
ncbi:hypothetical protein BN1723_004498 [Verticillium longisporum]|uniref:Uncharacterized protein n=2 Tax=Verticillium longisporum TaxID=100787 RepID=A0A0G4MXV6_VERLO|nr:hypothetical protein BN1723_004498 [Verticillium longisporum]